MAEDEVVENGGGGEGDKPKRKVKKPAAKPRGRSPAPNGGGSPPATSAKKTTKKKEKSQDLPCNPSRDKSGSPSKAKRPGRSTSPKKESSHQNNNNNGHHHHEPQSTTTSSKRDQSPAAGRKKKKCDSSPRPPKRNGTVEEPKEFQTNSSRGRSPENSSKRRLPCSGNSDKELSTSNSKPKGKLEGSRHKSPTRAASPKRTGKVSPSKHNSSNHNNNNSKSKPKPVKRVSHSNIHNSGQFSTGAHSLGLEDLQRASDEEDSDDEGTKAGAPRYISAKGHSTHLQLDLSTIGGAGGGSGEMPIFSLLDENSLLEGCTDDEGDQQQPKQRKPRDPKLQNPHRDSLLDNVNSRKLQVQRRLSTTDSPPPEPLQFQPWGFDDNDDDDDDNHHPAPRSPTATNHKTAHSPKANKSPLGKAFKALKYTTNMSGATNLMEKMSNNFQQRLGFAPQHQQMKDDDDLDSLLS